MQLYLNIFYIFALNNLNMPETLIKTDNKKTIHNACLTLIQMMNFKPEKVSQVIGISYYTAFKKLKLDQGLFFNEKDLEKLMTYYDESEKENIIKRRDILNLMYELKIR